MENIKEKNKKNNRGHHFFSRTPGLAKDFIDMCLEEIANEGYQGTSLKPISWTNIKDKLNAKYEGAAFDQKSLKNRWDHLKKKYLVWRELINKSGHGNDGVSFDWPDSVWDEVIKKNPEAKKFKTKPLEFTEELAKIFEGTLATGDNAGTPWTDDGDDDEHVDEEDLQDSYFEGVTFTPSQSHMPNTPIIEPGASSNIDAPKTTLGKRKKKEHTSDPDVQELICLLRTQHENNVKQMEAQKAKMEKEEAEKEAQKMAEKSYSMGECLKVLYAMKTYMTIPSKLVQIATVKFAEKAEYRQAFMEIEEEHKLVFLQGLEQL